MSLTLRTPTLLQLCAYPSFSAMSCHIHVGIDNNAKLANLLLSSAIHTTGFLALASKQCKFP